MGFFKKEPVDVRIRQHLPELLYTALNDRDLLNFHPRNSSYHGRDTSIKVSINVETPTQPENVSLFIAIGHDGHLISFSQKKLYIYSLGHYCHTINDFFPGSKVQYFGADSCARTPHIVNHYITILNDIDPFFLDTLFSSFGFS